MSVNGIIWLMLTVCLSPKVIPLSGTHFVMNFIDKGREERQRDREIET